MPFTPEQDKAAREALDRHLTKCPICGSNSWNLNKDLAFSPLVTGTDGVNLSRGYVSIVVICRVCGNTQFFNVPGLGLEKQFGLTPDPPEKADGE